MPKFIVRGKGCRLWDMEGKEYIDFRLALGPVTLGYCYDPVDDAVRAQLADGVLFSMASPIELELAGLIHQMVPNAERVRFMKTGEDANSANVRIARAYTKRDMILMSGYHGYPDWFSTEVPSQMCPGTEGPANRSAFRSTNARALEGRFVRIWYTCQSASSMTLKMARTNS